MKQNSTMNGRTHHTLFSNTATSIFPAMKFFSRHILFVFTLLAYLFGSVLVELAHEDELVVLLQSKPVLESHDCGAKELHVAWEDARHCIACSHFTQRLSPEVGTVFISEASLYLLAVLRARSEQTLKTDILFSGKRGPPAEQA
jgi:hypothetical protein